MTHLEQLEDLLSRTDDPERPVPVRIAAVVMWKRAELRRRKKIVEEYRELLNRTPRKRNVDRVTRAGRTLARRHKISVRSVQRYAARLAALRGATRDLLLGNSFVRFCDLPAEVTKTAHSRLRMLRDWWLSARAAIANGRSVEEALRLFLGRHPTASRSSLYRWMKDYRRYGLAGLIDGRAVWGVGGGRWCGFKGRSTPVGRPGDQWLGKTVVCQHCKGRARRRLKPASHFWPPGRITAPLGLAAIAVGVTGWGETNNEPSGRPGGQTVKRK